jgi:type II secretory pathway pseudopilin PulG
MHGVSLLETMFVVAILVVLAGVAVPGMLISLDASRAKAATKYLAGQMRLLRMEAVSRSTHMAMRFEFDGSSFQFAVYQDGNGNGVRTRDIRIGIDLRITEFERLRDRFPGVSFGLGASTPDAGGRRELGMDPIRIGRSDIVSFSPAGTATSGTLYVMGRSGRQYAVRLLGATGRIRVLTYSAETGQWLPD